MGGNSNFPTALDDDSSLLDVVDGVSSVIAAHHNNLKEAAKAIEQKVGVYNTSVPTSLDYRLGHPSSGHSHDGASGQGRPIDPTTIKAPSGAVGGATTLHGHMMDSNAHSSAKRHIVQSSGAGFWNLAGTNTLPPIFVPRQMWIEDVRIAVNQGPSAATAIFDINVNGTSLWYASQGNRPMFAPNLSRAISQQGTPNTVTIPSGAIIHFDLDVVHASGIDSPMVVFLFRE